MELQKKNIHMYRQARRAVSQVTLEEDFNVPDAKPDVETLIQNKAKAIIDTNRSETGRVQVKGHVQIGVLYMDNTQKRQIHRLDSQLKFDEFINMEGLEAGENVSVGCEIEDMSESMINSRKLSVRGVLTFTITQDEIYDISTATEAKSSLTLCQKKKKLEYMQMEVQKKDIVRIREEFLLSSNKPDIREILWENMQLRSCEVRIKENRLQVEGELFVFVLYDAQDENGTKQWTEHIIPVRGEVETGTMEEDLIPDVQVMLGQAEIQFHEDMDGENRMFHLEGTLELDIRLYACREMEILEDVFSPEKELEVFAREEMYESLVMRNGSRLRASGRIMAEGGGPRILQICSCQGTVKMDEVQLRETGIQIEGAVPVQILYVSSDDSMPFAMLEGSIPFSHFADVPGIDDTCRYHLSADLEQLSAAMADSEAIEVRASVSLNLLVVRPRKQMCIADISEKDLDLQKIQQLPGIVGYIVQQGDCLWDIARKYYTTPQRIMQMNGLESEEISGGEHLIIMKEVERVNC